MPKMIFVNLPVTDLPRSIAFYEAMGLTKDERFCDDSAAMLVLSDTIAFMLITHERFRDFTPKTIVDARDATEVLLSLSVDSRAEVDQTIDRAEAAGGAVDPCPLQDHGFMYGRSYEDPDGHIFEIMWMDAEAAVPAIAPDLIG